MRNLFCKMAGIIEDKIFEVLMAERLTARDIQDRLKGIHCTRKDRTLRRHLRKMFIVRMLEREIVGNSYVYWNSAETQKVYGVQR